MFRWWQFNPMRYTSLYNYETVTDSAPLPLAIGEYLIYEA